MMINTNSKLGYRFFQDVFYINSFCYQFSGESCKRFEEYDSVISEDLLQVLDTLNLR